MRKVLEPAEAAAAQQSTLTIDVGWEEQENEIKRGPTGCRGVAEAREGHMLVVEKAR